MLPRPTGLPALHAGRRARARGPRLGGARRTLVISTALALLAGMSFLAPSPAGAATGPDVWTPSTWTGPAAGPPVPGSGLPAAPAPAQPAGVPPGYDVAPTYEGQSQCDPPPKPGTQKLSDLIKATYGASQTVWIPRACDIGGQSEHKEGRALDWMTSVRDAQGRANAEAFLTWLLGPDQFGNPYGNAMRLGVMYIGWNDRIWRGYDIARGWTELKGCFATPSTGMDTTCHRNHIHISLTWDGASGRSSFWDGTPMDGPYCPSQRTSAGTVPGGRGAAVPIAPVHVLGTRQGIGVPARCRLQQDRWSGDSHRIYVKVTGVGGVPATGVAAVQVQVQALGSNADSRVRIWAPGQNASQIVDKVGMNQDATGTAIVPVGTDGTIALATSAGATDLSVDVVAWFPPGDQPNTTQADPGPATGMGPDGSGAGVPPPGVPAGTSPAAPAPAPAPGTPAPAPTPAAPLEDEFISIGSEVGYESSAQGPLAPGETRVVDLAGLPPNATSALVLVTTREATKHGSLRIGLTADVNAAPQFKFPKRRTRSAVMVVPVSNKQVRFVTSSRSSVHVRVEVLGYAINGKPVKVRGLPSLQISKARLEAGATLPLGPLTGLDGLPGRTKKISGVILQITTRTSGKDPGSVTAYPMDGAPPGTRSAPVTPGKPYTTLVVTEVGTDGRIVLSASVKASVRASIVGWVHR